MRIVLSTTAMFAALISLTSLANAQTYQAPNSLGGAANILNGLVNPPNNQAPQPNQNYQQPNQGYQQSNQGYQQSNQGYGSDNRQVGSRGGPFAQYNDDQLRLEARRVHEQDRMLDDEMRRRNLR